MICKFNRLDQLSIKKVVIKFVDELKRSLVEKNISLNLTEELIDHLAEVGYDPKMGARPLSRKIDELIKVPLSKKILFDSLRDCSLTLGWKDGGLTFDQVHSHSGSVDKNGYVVV